MYHDGQSDEPHWGRWSVLQTGEAWCVRRLDVMPGQILSLQRHKYRDEAWVAAQGAAHSTVGTVTQDYAVGESFIIPRRTRHRLVNPQAEGTLTFIEAQRGDRLDNCDIERFEDVYRRV